jgi:hypothetical protein
MRANFSLCAVDVNELSYLLWILKSFFVLFGRSLKHNTFDELGFFIFDCLFHFVDDLVDAVLVLIMGPKETHSVVEVPDECHNVESRKAEADKTSFRFLIRELEVVFNFELI